MADAALKKTSKVDYAEIDAAKGISAADPEVIIAIKRLRESATAPSTEP